MLMLMQCKSIYARLTPRVLHHPPSMTVLAGLPWRLLTLSTMILWAGDSWFAIRTPLRAPPLSTHLAAAATAAARSAFTSTSFRFFVVVFFASPFFWAVKRGGGLGSSSPGPPPALLTWAIAESEKSNCHWQETTTNCHFRGLASIRTRKLVPELTDNCQ